MFIDNKIKSPMLCPNKETMFNKNLRTPTGFGRDVSFNPEEV